MRFSCYGCTKRTAECHSNCEIYAKEKLIYEQERKMMSDPVRTYVSLSIGRAKDTAAKQRKRHALKAGCIR